MKSENKRIFISDLPETLTKEELESSFSKYGQVSSVEIKERKELGPNNKSLFFAYINVNTDDSRLNQCFRDLSNVKWHGQYVQLQIARESFLERLKRERQEAENKPVAKNAEKVIPSKSIIVQNGISTSKKYNIKISDSSSDIEDKLDITTKSNKTKLHDKNALKIASVGKAPIAEISLTKPKAKANDCVANLKRLQSLKAMKKDYEAQKSLIKNALTYGANKATNKKIVFDDTNTESEHQQTNGFQKNLLFNENNSEDESDFEANFAVKEQFQGKTGQKLLELQSKYNNDKRFALDERFMEPEKDAPLNENDLETEKNEQLKILEQVLGKKITPKAATKRSSEGKKIMVKFDPLQPDHANLQLAIEEGAPGKKKKKAKEQEQEDPSKPKPKVSKETFYKVPEKLKDTFQEKPQFSLLSLYGKKDSKEDDEEKQTIETAKEIKPSHLQSSQNPFKYDSSDDEDELGDIPHKSATTTTVSNQGKEIKPYQPAKTSQSVFWTEPFFFKSDDFRLQEGLDFMEKIKSEDKEFLKIRRELKGIVKAKVKNNQRKNRMFKKKLGGSKRRKHIRIKKALKR